MYDETLFSKRIEGVKYIKKYLVGKGIDVGCGTSPLHPHILTLDQNPNREYAYADIVHDCKDLDCFAEQTFDFIFSSHVLEDFEDIPEVFRSWWSRLKRGGVMVLLLPDIEGGRYPACGTKGANPSHRFDVGAKWFSNMLEGLALNYKIEQIDTIPHNEGCTFDLVVRRTN